MFSIAATALLTMPESHLFEVKVAVLHAYTTALFATASWALPGLIVTPVSAAHQLETSLMDDNYLTAGIAKIGRSTLDVICNQSKPITVHADVCPLHNVR